MAADAAVNFNLLNRTCKLVVLLCFLHISVTLFFYVRSSDVRFGFAQHQQHTFRLPASSNRTDQSLRAGSPPQTAVEEEDRGEGDSSGPAEPTPGKAAPEPEKSAPEPEKSAPEPEKSAPEPEKSAPEPEKSAPEPEKSAPEPEKSAPEPEKSAPEPEKSAPEPEKPLEKCPETSPLLVGPLRVEFMKPSPDLEKVKKDNPRITSGGRFKPPDCVAQQKVAMIIPFRNRDEHLKYWLYYLHPILQRQQLDYGVYVINQFGNKTFNRAKLLNIGYAEALKDHDYECFVFSDVDIIPMDDRNIYKCYSQPRHLSVSMDKFGFRLPYLQYFGGVSSMSKEQYLRINGFPNNYWGWGGEDDDIFNRLSSKGMSISRPTGEVGKCRMIRHQRDQKNEDNPQRFNRIAHTRETMHKDGINSLTYRVVKTERLDLFTLITVDVGSP